MAGNEPNMLPPVHHIDLNKVETSGWMSDSEMYSRFKASEESDDIEELVRLLCGGNSDVNFGVGVLGTTPLCEAAARGYVSVVPVLLGNIQLRLPC